MRVASTKNFNPESDARMACRCCGALGIKQEALDKLQKVRDEYGKPMVLTSGYRCEKHPSEARKKAPGQHYKGTAFDIRVSNGAEAHALMKLAFKHGATGVALGNGFVHMDWRNTTPVSWRY